MRKQKKNKKKTHIVVSPREPSVLWTMLCKRKSPIRKYFDSTSSSDVEGRVYQECVILSYATQTALGPCMFL